MVIHRISGLIFKLQRPTSYRCWQKDGTSSGRDLKNRFSAEQEIDRLKTSGCNECPTVCGKLLKTTPLQDSSFEMHRKLAKVDEEFRGARDSLRVEEVGCAVWTLPWTDVPAERKRKVYWGECALDRCACWECSREQRVWTRRTGRRTHSVWKG